MVVFRRTGGVGDIDAIDDYSSRLVGALVASGLSARYEPRGLMPVLAAARRPPWILLQYNPFRYGRWGLAPGLVRDVLAVRRRGVPFAITVHEAWVDGIMAGMSRAELAQLLELLGKLKTAARHRRAVQQK